MNGTCSNGRHAHLNKTVRVTTARQPPLSPCHPRSSESVLGLFGMFAACHACRVCPQGCELATHLRVQLGGAALPTRPIKILVRLRVRHTTWVTSSGGGHPCVFGAKARPRALSPAASSSSLSTPKPLLHPPEEAAPAQGMPRTTRSCSWHSWRGARERARPPWVHAGGVNANTSSPPSGWRGQGGTHQKTPPRAATI